MVAIIDHSTFHLRPGIRKHSSLVALQAVLPAISFYDCYEPTPAFFFPVAMVSSFMVAKLLVWQDSDP